MTKALLLTDTADATALTRRQTFNFAQSLDELTGGHTQKLPAVMETNFHYLFHNSARLVLILGQIN